MRYPATGSLIKARRILHRSSRKVKHLYTTGGAPATRVTINKAIRAVVQLGSVIDTREVVQPFFGGWCRRDSAIKHSHMDHCFCSGGTELIVKVAVGPVGVLEKVVFLIATWITLKCAYVLASIRATAEVWYIGAAWVAAP
jgi:hypothetical protein